MLNMTDLVDMDDDWCQDFNIVRVKGSYDSSGGASSGEWVVAPLPPEPANGAVIPNPSPDVLAVLPEGERSNQAIVVYTKSSLRVQDNDGDQNPETDYVLWSGQIWKVVHAWNWSGFGFYKALCTQSPLANLGVTA